MLLLQLSLLLYSFDTAGILYLLYTQDTHHIANISLPKLHL